MNKADLVAGGIMISGILIIAIVDWTRPLADRRSKIIAAVVIVISAIALWVVGGPMFALTGGGAITAQSVWLWYFKELPPTDDEN